MVVTKRQEEIVSTYLPEFFTPIGNNPMYILFLDTLAITRPNDRNEFVYCESLAMAV